MLPVRYKDYLVVRSDSSCCPPQSAPVRICTVRVTGSDEFIYAQNPTVCRRMCVHPPSSMRLGGGERAFAHVMSRPLYDVYVGHWCATSVGVSEQSRARRSYTKVSRDGKGKHGHVPDYFRSGLHKNLVTSLHKTGVLEECAAL
jgi:hypothetical protein